MRAWRRGLAAFAAVPGACAKLSGLGMLRPDGAGVARIADGLLEAFGPERVMWGSNVPVDALQRPWADLLAEARAAVPTAAAADVFERTARRFYAP
jgi:L-fuconolactonase